MMRRNRVPPPSPRLQNPRRRASRKSRLRLLLPLLRPLRVEGVVELVAVDVEEEAENDEVLAVAAVDEAVLAEADIRMTMVYVTSESICLWTDVFSIQ